MGHIVPMWANYAHIQEKDPVSRLNHDVYSIIAFIVDEGSADEKVLESWLQQYSYDEITTALYEAKRFLRRDRDGIPTDHTRMVAWKKIPALLEINRQAKDDPLIKPLIRIQGIIRRRAKNKKLKLVDLMRKAVKDGAKIEDIEAKAKVMTDLSDFIAWVAYESHGQEV